MKKIFRNNRLIAIAFFTVFTSGTVMAARTDTANNTPIELKLIGSFNNQTIFQLKVAGDPVHDNYFLAISDTYGNCIYQENIRANSFSKKFLFDTDELGDDTLQLEVYNKKTKQSVVYEINRFYKPAQDIVWSK